MKINTDLVKNKKFTTPVKSDVLKHSQEYRVLATLRYLYPMKFDTMITGETPDLQDSVNSLGIEVTAAVKENDMKVSRAFSELYHGSPKEIERRKETIESNGYVFVSFKDEKDAIATSGTSDGERRFFLESIRKKTKKLQQYRINFKKIGLAIILPEIPTSYAENHFSEWIFEAFEDANNSFDFIYLISHRFCIYYDVQENISEKHSLTSNESWLLSKIGRMTAEGELSITDSEWL